MHHGADAATYAVTGKSLGVCHGESRMSPTVFLDPHDLTALVAVRPENHMLANPERSLFLVHHHGAPKCWRMLLAQAATMKFA